jgi:phosphoribosylaminoimidazolecarboxamide formyltransferase / IMP cyclohydrolase
LRQRLAAEAFAHTAAYDRAIADYFAREGQTPEDFGQTVNITLQKQMDLRYGENPHQKAAVYREVGARGVSVVSARQLNGKELSYNNLLDLDSALAIVRSFAEPAATVIKHNNPCGAATSLALAEAAKKALEGDPQSAFGGIIAFNRAVDEATAEVLATPGLFIEAVVAPEFAEGALEILKTKPKWKANVRLMAVGSLDSPPPARHYRFIEGGALAQDADVQDDPVDEWKVVTKRIPTPEQLADLRFTWAIVRHVKSNAIAIGRDGMLLGAGAGQMSRVDSVDIAIAKAGERVGGAVLASDAFFPFPDSIFKASAAGITAIIQPGGSVKDDEVIAACDEHGLAMMLTGRRHFKH